MYLCAYTVLRVFARCHVAWIVCMCTHTHTHSYLQLHRTYWITIDRMYSYVNIYKYMHIQSRSIIHNNIQSHPYHISWPILFHYIYIYHMNPTASILRSNAATSNLAREMLQEKSMPSSRESTCETSKKRVAYNTRSELISWSFKKVVCFPTFPNFFGGAEALLKVSEG